MTKITRNIKREKSIKDGAAQSEEIRYIKKLQKKKHQM